MTTQKITYTGTDHKAYEYKFVLNDSILKTHFKMLMRLGYQYKNKGKTGLIKKNDVALFLDLVRKIEKSSSARCKSSHAKSIEKLQNKITEYKCEHEDLGSMGYRHGDVVKCEFCGEMATVW